MKETKFRAWVNENQSMWYSDSKKAEDNIYFLLINSSGPYLSPVHHQEDYDEYTDFELMQYTGLKDKNGKEVYESDIVKFEWQGEDVGVINYIGACFKISEMRSFHDVPLFLHYPKIEVVGNIYENPGLLPKAIDSTEILSEA